MGLTAACIDITGSSRAMDVAYLKDNTLKLRTETNLKNFLDWVTDQQPQFVAVDAPSKETLDLCRNSGLTTESRKVVTRTFASLKRF